MSEFSSVRIGNVRVDAIKLRDVLEFCTESLVNHIPATLMYANAHAVTLAAHDTAFANALDSADVVFCDGYGVYVGARILGHPVPERFTPPDWISQLVHLCVETHSSMYFLGSRPGVAQEAATILLKHNPLVHIESHHGYFEKEGLESDLIVRIINESQAGVVLVGFGMPMQELWVTRNRKSLNAPVVMTVGALFGHLAGVHRRAPTWMTNNGFEWLGRLVAEPSRLWTRYLIGLPVFCALVLKQLFKNMATSSNR